MSTIKQAAIDEARTAQKELLFQACEYGDLDRVKEIIEANKAAGDDWNYFDQRDRYAYNMSDSQKPNPISWLLNCQCETFWTPIMFAARYGHTKVV